MNWFNIDFDLDGGSNNGFDFFRVTFVCHGVADIFAFVPGTLLAENDDTIVLPIELVDILFIVVP